MPRRPITWERIRGPFYASLGTVIVGSQILAHQWNPIACGMALSLFGMPGIYALRDLVSGPRIGSDSTRSSSDSLPSPGPHSSSSGQSGDDRHDESA
jgi:hypothetical protein